MEKLYTCEEVARRYGMSVYTVWQWIKSGSLSAIKLGKSYRITEAMLSDFEKKRTVSYSGGE